MNPNKLENANRKKQAFKSFLQTTASPNTTDSKKNASDHQEVYEQQYVEQSTACNVCGEQVPDAQSKKKNCAFCTQVACAEHLRKRRRKKNKWEKICDSCEDKYLYDTYMKLEIKAQQSLAVEEEIVAMKYEDMKQVLENKKVRRRELSFNGQQIQSKYDQKMMALIKQDNRFQSINNKLQSDELTCHQIEQYIQRMEKKIKSNYQQDFRILTEEDEKLGSQLSTIEKRCTEIRAAIEKRQKQLEQAYEQWEKKQYGRQIAEQPTKKSKKQQGCFIF